MGLRAGIAALLALSGAIGEATPRPVAAVVPWAGEICTGRSGSHPVQPIGSRR